ncbi:hypothetical protein BDZ45DRAFT_696572 [Acephala macrosclerotiorum]|nr:hypothetical protein BDZ45DRAFT_696572 [Acephala macrosclerotiorum]
MHWTDIERAMESFARQVKSGGTVAISFYGRSLIVNNPKALAGLEKVYDVWVAKLHEGGGFPSRASRVTDSAFDIVTLSAEYWEPGAKRIFINTEGKKEPICMSLKNMKPFETRVGKDDVMEAERDDAWTDVKDLEWVKGFFTSVLPNIPEEDVKEFWAQVEKAVGGPDKLVDIVYPAVQLLATRK